MQTSAPPPDAFLIVILDPRAALRAELGLALSQAGFDSEDAQNLDEARNLCTTLVPDLVLVPDGTWADGLDWTRVWSGPDCAGVRLASFGKDGELEPYTPAGLGASSLARHAPPELTRLLRFVHCAIRAERAERELDFARRLLEETERVGRVGHWRVAPRTGEMHCSRTAMELLGLEGQDGRARLESAVKVIEPGKRNEFLDWIEQALERPTERGLEVRLALPGGGFRQVAFEPGQVLGTTEVCGFVREADSNEKAAQRAADPDQRSPVDQLVWLPDRAEFKQLLAHGIAGAGQRQRPVAVLCLGIRGPQDQQPSDPLLRAMAGRLESSLRDHDLLGRMSRLPGGVEMGRLEGDLFAVQLELLRSPDASSVGRRLLEVLSLPYVLHGQELSVRPCMGIALYPDDAKEAGELLDCAEAAARHARKEESGPLEFYARALNKQLSGAMALESDLRLAIARGELSSYYQPKIEIASGRIVGLEALVRWKHPTLGMISPAQFIPLAEETGLILPIGRIVLEQACTQARRWQDEGLPPVRMAVNLSSVQFREPDLLGCILNTLDAAKLAPQWLELELTESTLMENKDSSITALRSLKDEGIHISIDDFGTGYSSLSYLKRFPIDALKIDQSFVREINTNPDDAAIATSIILMGRSLRLRVVAEGVETKSQLAFLRVMQCDEAQGYLFSPPLPAEKLRELLTRGEGRLAA